MKSQCYYVSSKWEQVKSSKCLLKLITNQKLVRVEVDVFGTTEIYVWFEKNRICFGALTKHSSEELKYGKVWLGNQVTLPTTFDPLGIRFEFRRPLFV